MNEHIAGVKAVVFDLGNVIIELHYERSIRMLTNETGMTEKEVSEMLVTSPLLQQLEVGAISEEEFRTSFSHHMRLEFSDEAFDAMWNGFLGDVTKERIDRMLRIREKYRTFVLSNTNSIHERFFNDSLKSRHAYSKIDDLVDQAYYSHKVGIRKPDASIYKHLLRQEGLQPGEVLFIDDRLDNIQSASKLGIRTFHNTHVDLWLELPLI